MGKEKLRRINAIGQRKYYRKNKQKYMSRIATLLYVNGKTRSNYTFKKIDGPEKICKSCGSKENLQIHHEIYPTKKKEIIKAIENGYIYYLCKTCHSNLRLKKE